MPTLQTNPLRALLGLSDDPNYPQNPLASLGDNQAPNLIDYFRQAESSRNPGHNAGIDARAAAQEARDKEQADKENEALIARMPDVSAEADKAQQEKLAQLGEPNRVLGENAKAAQADKYKQLQDFLTTRGGATTDNGAGPSSFRMNINSNMEPSFAEVPAKPLGQLEQRSITSFKEAQPILDDLEKTLHPGGNQFYSLLKNRVNSGLYSAGIATDPESDAKTQLSGLLQVLGSSPYVVGSRSYQMIKLAMQHLTNPGQSDAAMQQRINEIRSLWPRMQEEVLAAHNTPGSPLNQGASADQDYTNENWGR